MCGLHKLEQSLPKDSYPLPIIDGLVDTASDFCLLSSMDAYSECNQIPMHPCDAKKIAYTTPKSNYCYIVMPFRLKNMGVTY